MKKLYKIMSGTGNIGYAFICAFMLLIALVLFFGSMVSTCNMDNDSEKVFFLNDSVLLNILSLFMMCFIGTAIIYIAKKYNLIQRINVPNLSWVLAIWIFVACVLWIVQSLSAPTHDSYLVTRAGVAAAMGDYSYIKNDYFIRFPFQLGYVLWTELWARLLFFRHDGYIVMQFINALALASSELALVRITHRLFSNKTLTFAVFVMLALFFQPIIFVTFVYGNIPGFAFGIWAILLFIMFVQEGKYKYIIISSLLLAISVGIKLNNIIILVAICIVLAIKFLQAKKVRNIIGIAIACLLVIGLKGVGQTQYEFRTGEKFGNGIPMASWLAMGLNDASSAPGWYSHEYTVGNFHACGKDYALAQENSIKEIKSRIEYFSSNREQALTFFKDKTYSQWNETSFQSIWNNQIRGQYDDKIGIAKFVCENGEVFSKRIMDITVQFLYFGLLASFIFLIYDIVRKKEIRAEIAVIPLVILGGFLYHTLFEAKSQYVLTYVVMMIPYAIYGFYRISVLLNKKVRRFNQIDKTPFEG